MGGSYSVKNTLEVMDLGFSVASAVKAANSDGEISLKDIPLLFPVIFSAPAAVEDIGQVPSELSELDIQDQAEIVQHFSAKIPEITDDAKVLQLAGAYLKAGLAIGEAVALTLQK